MFKLLDHPADLKFVVKAKNLEDLFKEIGKAVYYGIFNSNKIKKIQEKKEIKVNIEPLDIGLHDFIEDLIFIANYEGKKFKIEKIDLNKKTITLGLEKAKRKDYDVEVKGCAYNINIKKNKEFEVKFILDI